VAGILTAWLLASTLFDESGSLWDGFVNWWDLPDSERRTFSTEGLDEDGWKFVLVLAFGVLCGVLTYYGLHKLFG
jgi:hypothetical protein